LFSLWKLRKLRLFFQKSNGNTESPVGAKFDNFAKKAVIFEYNERKGMADIFLDIVEENAAILL